MTRTDERATRSFTIRRIAPPDGACNVVISSDLQPPATVIRVSGEIDAHNAEYVSDYLLGFVHADHPLVLDLGGLEFMGVAGFRALIRFAAACREVQRSWALVASEAVNILLRVTDYWLPVVDSMDEALQWLSERESDLIAPRGSTRC
jgi:anti-anti-sigma factor